MKISPGHFDAMYAPPPEIATRIHARLPRSLARPDVSSRWVTARGGGPLGSFLEGPSFDRSGALFCTDLAHGRIFRLPVGGDALEVFADYDGEPNGLKIHRDGRIFVADRRHGILVFDAAGRWETVLAGPKAGERFNGPNDLVFARNGDLYFTDQGDSALEAPFGRVFRLSAAGSLDLVLSRLAGPNGLVFDRDEKILYVAETRTNRILSVPIRADGTAHKCGVFLQLSGSPTGPDGLALDVEGNLAVVHAGAGTVWLFNRLGEPVGRIRSCAGLRTTNLAYGGETGRTLFVTEAEQAVILAADLPVPGQPMFSHL